MGSLPACADLHLCGFTSHAEKTPARNYKPRGFTPTAEKHLREKTTTADLQATRFYTYCGKTTARFSSMTIFFSRRKKMPTIKLRIDGKEIPYTDSVVYLGVTLDKKLHWKKHIEHKITPAKKRLIQLSHATRYYWGPKPPLIKWAYTSTIRPILGHAPLVLSLIHI